MLLIGSGAGASLVRYSCNPPTHHPHIPPNQITANFGISPTPVDSTQAASVALKARDNGATGIAGLLLDFPMMCHPKFHPQAGRLELRSYEQNAEATTISSPLVDLFYDTYVPGPSADEAGVAYHSPLLAPSLAHMPPARKSKAG